MDILSLNKQLKEIAIQNGLCQQWQDEWQPDTDTDGLIDKFLRGIDFYLSTRFISKRQMLLWFTPEDRHKHNIVVDERRSLLNPRCGIAIGNSVVKIRSNARSVNNFYATGNTHLNLIVKGNSHLRLTLCDNASIDTVQVSEGARLFVTRAGENTQAIQGENITIKDNFNLYQ